MFDKFEVMTPSPMLLVENVSYTGHLGDFFKDSKKGNIWPAGFYIE